MKNSERLTLHYNKKYNTTTSSVNTLNLNPYPADRHEMTALLVSRSSGSNYLKFKKNSGNIAITVRFSLLITVFLTSILWPINKSYA
jgi:hypothetical protein